MVISYPLITVVIVNYNGEHFIEDCLNSVLASSYPNFEVVVVDNNSADRSVQILKKFKDNPKLTVILLNSNLHFAGGNNVGINHSKGEYIVFLNFDTIVNRNWLNELTKTFQSKDNISAVQCLLLRADGKTIDSAGGTIDYCVKLVGVRHLWARNKAAAEHLQLFYGCGAALAIRRSVLAKIGVFDSAFPTDEVDICWRINLSGGQIVLSPRSVVHHFRSGAFGQKLNEQRVFFAETAAISCMLKNYEIKNLFLVLPYYLFFLIVVTGADILIRHRPTLTLSRLKAFIFTMRNLRAIFDKRAQVQTMVRKVSDEEVRKLMVRPTFQYFSLSH